LSEGFGKSDVGYRVIPLLLPGITPKALENCFEEEPVAILVQPGPAGLGEALPDILAGLGTEEMQRLADELIKVGLAEDLGYGHLRLDPGLAPYLRSGMNAEKADALRSRWANAMAQLATVVCLH
jgi:hypothetical protein